MKKSVKDFLKSREITALLFLVVMFLSVGAVNPAFLKIRNFALILNGSIVFIILAIGISFVIISGEIDVSIGATLGISAAVSSTMIRDGKSYILALIVALLIGALVGLVNGIGVNVLKVPSIIMTLGVNGVVRGLVYVYTGGKWIENLPYEFKSLSQATLFEGITYFLIITMIVMIIVHLLLTKTRRGRYFAAVGDNEAGAELVGIPVEMVNIVSFVICGVFAALAGVMYVSRVGFVTPMAGNGYEMKAIAACVLGGISLTGGVGTVLGATIGAVIMSSISRVLVFLKLSADYDNTITGILLIIIVVVDATVQARMKEKARRKRLSARLMDPSEGGSCYE